MIALVVVVAFTSSQNLPYYSYACLRTVPSTLRAICGGPAFPESLRLSVLMHYVQVGLNSDVS